MCSCSYARNLSYRQRLPRYRDFLERFDFYEDPEAGHDFSAPIRERTTAWLVRHLIEKPVLVEHNDAR